MARRYYTLIVWTPGETGKTGFWSDEFGSYSRNEVQSEIEFAWSHMPRGHVKIVSHDDGTAKMIAARDATPAPKGWTLEMVEPTEKPRGVEIEPNTWGPFRHDRLSRYSLTVVEIAARHLMIVRGHDGVTVHVTGDESDRLRAMCNHLAEDTDAARSVVESGAAYVGIDIMYVHRAIEAHNG